MRVAARLVLALSVVHLVLAHRVRLPSDHRDENIDDDDVKLLAQESIGYFRDRKLFDENGRSDAEWIEQISHSPRAYVYRGFLSDAECDHVISRAYGTMTRSLVVDEESGGAQEHDGRTSMGGWVSSEEDEVIRDIELRVSTWAMLPRNRGETMQVMRYEAGQQYEAHDDFFHDELNILNGGQRVATVLMYLSDVEEGGETVFPLGTPLGGQSPDKSGVTEENACELAVKGDPRVVAVKPRRGDALLFFDAHLNGEMDVHSKHAGCPVLRGTKWTMTRWHRVGAVDVGTFAWDPRQDHESRPPVTAPVDST